MNPSLDPLQISYTPETDTLLINGERINTSLLREHARCAKSIETLSAREQQVVDLVIAGVPQKEIAARLNLSFKTVHTYLTNAKAHLSVASTASLIRMFALKN